MARGKSGYYLSGGNNPPSSVVSDPRVDKDPFYKTMDIFNGVFKKKIRLVPGQINRTDLHVIEINFGELKPSKISQIVRDGSDDMHSIFMLECGHEWEGKKITKCGIPKAIGNDYGMCGICGADGIYRSFEHEWQHIIFKSDLSAASIFCEQYAQQLISQAPGIDKIELRNFIHFIVNAFDDIRVNSLWEKVYPGSAMAIWERWRYLVSRMGDHVNSSFMAYLFAVAFSMPTNSQGEFEPMRPVIERAMKEVRYRGFNNMLLEVRIVLDRCMGALLAKLKPKPQPTMQPPPLQSPEKPEEQSPPAQPQEDQQEPPPTKDSLGVPSASDVSSSPEEVEKALSRLMQDPVCLDTKEEHSAPRDGDLEQAKKSQSTRAAINKILSEDITDVDSLKPDQPTGELDQDMQTQVDQLLNGIAQKSESSQLTDNAKAKIVLIDVTNEGQGDFSVTLAPEDEFIIQRLRAIFFRSMGKQKAKRTSVGTSVDVESLIQYLGDRQDDHIFAGEDTNQGFAYSVVCDMSGSMKGTFPIVCQAVEMLKKALDFPFVEGTLWGFRGGQDIGPSTFWGGAGDVWMYKYSPDVNWYTGIMPKVTSPGNGAVDIPVRCGGITPMNSAINVATNHLWRKMPAGMVKRMFLLTDGSPVQIKLSGKALSESTLRQFVANEIKKARGHGIEVYTLVIGQDAIEDDKCLQMFGPRKFWKKVNKDRIGTVLLSLVLQNFTRYLRRA